MRRSFRLCVLIALFAVSPPIASAQSHAELQTLVQQLQSNPSDTALRERIITTARALKPAPAIPEEARESFVQGTTIAQSAKDATGQALAVQRFEQALKIAPWWGDAWYNLAIAQELAGQLDAAQASLKLYLLTGPSEAEARKTQDHMYALKAKKDLAATEAANAAAQAAARQVEDLAPLMRSLDGARFVRDFTTSGIMTSRYLLEIHGNTVTYVHFRMTPPYGDSRMQCTLDGLSCNLCCGVPGTSGADPNNTHSLTIAADGRSATYKFIVGGQGTLDTRTYHRSTN